MAINWSAAGYPSLEAYKAAEAAGYGGVSYAAYLEAMGAQPWAIKPTLMPSTKITSPGQVPDVIKQTGLNGYAAPALNGQGAMPAGLDWAAIIPFVWPFIAGLFGGMIGGQPGTNGDNGNGVYGPPLTKTPWPWDVAEPPNYMVKKRWETRVYSNEHGYIKINFYLLNDMAGKYAGIVMCYNNATGNWSTYKPKKHVVISSDPRMSSIGKLERTYNKTIKRLARKSKALKLAKGR